MNITCIASGRHFWLSSSHTVFYMIQRVTVSLSKTTRWEAYLKISGTPELVWFQILCSGCGPESFSNLMCPLLGSSSSLDVWVVARSVQLSCLLASKAIHVVMHSPPSAPHVAREPNKWITTREEKLPLGFRLWCELPGSITSEIQSAHTNLNWVEGSNSLI